MSVVIVDLVSIRDFNLYAELLRLIHRTNATLGADPPSIYAASCRWRADGDVRLLDVWNRPLEIGQPLPVLPPWLTEDFAVPLDLEASYEQACRDLRLV